jgi:hypothetical protein
MWAIVPAVIMSRLGGRYATDLTDAALAQIEPFLPPSRPSGRSRTTILLWC